jgi:hypothetical protein
LWFSTTITFSPFFSSKLLDYQSLIVGGAAGFGCGITCACKTKVKKDLIVYILFFYDGSVLFWLCLMMNTNLINRWFDLDIFFTTVLISSGVNSFVL